jgi:hypothetical protein
MAKVTGKFLGGAFLSVSQGVTFSSFSSFSLLTIRLSFSFFLLCRLEVWPF